MRAIHLGCRNMVVNALTPMFGGLRLKTLNRRAIRTWLADGASSRRSRGNTYRRIRIGWWDV